MNDETDLPLVSNVDDILVTHYSFNLKCNFNAKEFQGSLTLYLKCAKANESCQMCAYNNPVKNIPSHLVENDISNESCSAEMNNEANADVYQLNCRNIFKCIFDCQEIAVHQVQSVQKPLLPFHFLRQYKSGISDFHNSCDNGSSEYLNFSVDNWSVQIWKDDVYCVHNFPKVIRIFYSTKPSGLSLLWVKDQDGCNCVYTYGAWINNRSLFPCQEPPIAMATWEAMITVEHEAIVLMSGDEDPIVFGIGDSRSYYYYTKMVLPMSTLALAAGYWKGEIISLCNKPYNEARNSERNIHCRLFAPNKLFIKSKEQFSEYLLHSLQSVQELLGPYPFPRIDILIVPRGFGSLGMASPNIIFLSQSLLCNDKSMCVRLAHEIAHGWFGLLIGALDWTEEWLSEGFATFMEDIIHTRTMKMTSEDENNYCEIKYMLRLKTLLSELEHTDEELQILRPTQGQILKDNVDGVSAVYVKNGQNPKKGFLQVHYLKGYFLLMSLCKLVGKETFLQFLRKYIEMYRGQLVESKEVFKLYFEAFPLLRNKDFNIETIYDKWLNNSALPKEIANIKPSSDNQLYNDAVAEFKKWKKINKAFIKSKYNHKKMKLCWENFTQLQSEQLSIVLEKILDEDRVSIQTLKPLEQVYHLNERNADIKHRWCELIVKYQNRSNYQQVQNFLQDDLAMGVYLYGELLNSGIPSQQKLAEECFNKMHSEMEPNFQITIQKMIDEK